MTFTDYVFEFSSGLNKTAIIDKKNISYSELYCKVMIISHNIKEINIVKEDKILLISENSPFFIESYFGIIKSGCTCVPLNPTLSKNDIEYIINSCNPKAIFIEKRFLDNMRSLINKDIKIVTEETLNNLLLDKECTNNNEEEKEIDFKNSVAVILFTSGSTAKPKGVMLTHHNLCYNTNSIIEYFKLSSKDRIEVVLPFYYCFGTSLLHTHLRVGGSLVINNKFMFPETVLDDIEKYECTGFAGVPSNYQILLRKSSIKDRNLKSLRYVAQAGGRLPDSFIKELKQALEGVEVFIMYGQTEATARLSYLPPNMLDEKMGSIGKGIPGTLLKVIDKEGKEVKVDDIGEVVALGENIMKGYFNDEEETKKVIRNSYLYTGDLATVDEDGYIYIVAREKQIIKSGGNRISPKEIENIIIQIPSVIEAAVIGIQDDILGEAVKAFVVLNDEVLKVDEKYIIEYCKDKLPSYKVPKYVVFLDGLPKNSSGKVMMGDLK
ncbi:class I adenylate-forming enzyme family protein [Clostridium beijerinckii]|uniref:Acyl-CoA synthetase (AMP-forming)/AMP-acid ligase II n=1 Tax=Clostridium beijerinckii TaxID=1520 RepID=A0AAX0AYE2_CLOBE|nr:AMP-binding protein [Clostridium beijerinckii]NRT88055.1 acyl-CoA synthetase (AMP-forming)/AMP-acid ligase II [Clostridium beijerinckii]NYC73484.1 acyl-CoA synthetase (AMP-forming)/AMP-acid ligase II [Clostridium beijerinckii]